MADFGSCWFSNVLNTTTVPTITGVDTTFYAAIQTTIETAPGVYDFAALDLVIAAAVAAGIEPRLKVAVSTNPLLDIPPTAPADLLAWANFVTAVATQYVGVVSNYAIENEIDKPAWSAWTGATYFPVREAAYHSIKAVDAGANVLDSGLTEGAWLAYAAQQYVTAGDPYGALYMIDRFKDAARRSPVLNLPTTVAALTNWLAGAERVRSVGLVQDLIDNGHVDAIQIHSLLDQWEFMPELMGWLTAWLPGMPLQVWETGYSWDDVGTDDNTTWDEDDHAAGIVRMLGGLAGLGADVVIQEPYRTKPGVDPKDWKRGLVDNAGVALRAATAFSYMSGILTGCAATVVNWGTGVHAYSFAGIVPIYLAFAEQPTIVDLVALAGFTNEALISNIYGATKYISAQVVPLGLQPIYIISWDQPIQGQWIKRQ